MYIGKKAQHGNATEPLGFGKADGQPRWWLPLPNSHAVISPEMEAVLSLDYGLITTLGECLKGVDKLYEAYPRMKDIPIFLSIYQKNKSDNFRFRVNGSFTGTEKGQIQKNLITMKIEGEFSTKTIFTFQQNAKKKLFNNKRFIKVFCSVLLHEVMHAIQFNEGWKDGTTQSFEKQKIIHEYIAAIHKKRRSLEENKQSISPRFRRLIRQESLIIACTDNPLISRLETENPFHRAVRLNQRFDRMAEKSYFDDLGEVEARIVEKNEGRIQAINFSDHLYDNEKQPKTAKSSSALIRKLIHRFYGI